MVKNKKVEPLIPHYEHGVVVVRVPVGTPKDKAFEAIKWAKNLAKKYSKDWA